MTKRPLLAAVLACLLPAAPSASAKQYPREAPPAGQRERSAAPAADERLADELSADESPEMESSETESSGIRLPGSQSLPSGGGAARPRVITESLPYTPHPAGLTWVMTPQSFRVPIPDRFYYPPAHYVRRCPYYPRGYYWGANWRFNVIGCDNLLHCGTFRFNPYLTAHKAQHDPKLRGQRRYAMPPGPEGQAMLLLGGSPSRSTAAVGLAKKGEPKSKNVGEDEAQVAAADDAGEKPVTHPASSRRTARQRERNLD